MDALSGVAMAACTTLGLVPRDYRLLALLIFKDWAAVEIFNTNCNYTNLYQAYVRAARILIQTKLTSGVEERTSRIASVGESGVVFCVATLTVS